MRGAMKRFLILLVVLGLVFSPSCGKNKREDKKLISRGDKFLTIVFSSDLLGKVRSCGCHVKDMGGLGRMATYVQHVRDSADNLLVVDAGDAFGLDLSYSKTEAELTFDVFNLYGLDVFTPGETDYVFGLDFLKDLQLRSSFDFVEANVIDSKTNKPIFGKAYVVKEYNDGFKVGIVGVLDDSIRFPSYVEQKGLKVLPPAETLERILPRMKKECDFLVLLSHLGLERSMELARNIKDFDCIVVAHKRPVIKKLEKIGKTIVVATGGEGKYMGRLDLKLSPNGTLIDGRLKLEPLDDAVEISPTVKELFKKYGLVLTDKEWDKE